MEELSSDGKDLPSPLDSSWEGKKNHPVRGWGSPSTVADSIATSVSKE